MPGSVGSVSLSPHHFILGSVSTFKHDDVSMFKTLGTFFSAHRDDDVTNSPTEWHSPKECKKDIVMCKMQCAEKNSPIYAWTFTVMTFLHLKYIMADANFLLVQFSLSSVSGFMCEHFSLI